MPSASRHRAIWIRRTLAMLAVAAGYYFGGVVGTVLSVPPSGFAIIWPATAFLVAVLLITPLREWWLHLIGVVAAHVLLATQTSNPPLFVMLTQVGGNIGLAAATVLALRAVSKEPTRFDSFRDVLCFVTVGAVAVPAIGNALILSVHLLTGWTDAFWLSWRQWMMASVFPTLIVPPALMLVARRGFVRGIRARPKQAAEFLALCILLFASTYVAFGWRLDDQWWPQLPLVLLPLVLWVAVRYPVGATSMAIACIASAIILRALNGQGPFAVPASNESVFSLQVFLSSLTLPLLLLSSLMQERRRYSNLLQQSEARIEVVAASTDTGLWQWNEETQQLWTTEHCRSMFGIDPLAPLTPDIFIDTIHAEDRAKVRSAMALALTRSEMTSEFRVPTPDGSLRWMIARTHTEFDKLGAAVRVSGVFRDVTQRINAQLEAEELGERLLSLQDEERREIASELHDSTAQSLVAASLNLGALKSRFSPDGEAARLIDESLSSIRQASNELRTFTYLLRPPGLDDDGLRALLQRYLDGFSRRTGLRATLKASAHIDRLQPQQQRALLRITQESLANVHRHADATRVSVMLRRLKGDTHLIIQDDGQGMQAEGRRKPAPLGVGIPGMIARVRQLGGRMTVRSDTRGTIVHAAIPIAYAADAIGAPKLASQAS